MKLYLRYNPKTAFQKIIEQQFAKIQIPYRYLGYAEIEVDDSVSGTLLQNIESQLREFGIEIIENQKSILVQKIKDTIHEMVDNDEKPLVSNSVYLAEKLNTRYEQLSAVFSEITFTSIEYYILLRKVERVKQLITTSEMTFAEISYLLNYSSPAHLSNQFKSITGLTPTAFQRIIKRRRETKVPDPSGFDPRLL